MIAPNAAVLTVPARGWLRHLDFSAGVVLLVLILIGALFALPVTAKDLQAVYIGDRLQAPFWLPQGHPGSILGTDQLGRDVLTRLLYGARISLTIGVLATVLSAVIGVILGLLAGYYGGAVDAVIMRITDVFLAFPGIILSIIAISVLGAGVQNLVIVLAITSWEIYARTVRGVILSLRRRDFVIAALSVGASDARILVRHLLVNSMTPIFIIASLQVASMILTESALSFLGLGIQPPTPSWGKMVAEGREYLDSAWWISTFPGIAIVLTVLGVKFTSDGLADMLDPRSRGRS